MGADTSALADQQLRLQQQQQHAIHAPEYLAYQLYEFCKHNYVNSIAVRISLRSSFEHTTLYPIGTKQVTTGCCKCVHLHQSLLRARSVPAQLQVLLLRHYLQQQLVSCVV
jgi:hypothetical protein